jgi:hypothetical protein
LDTASAAARTGTGLSGNYGFGGFSLGLVTGVFDVFFLQLRGTLEGVLHIGLVGGLALGILQGLGAALGFVIGQALTALGRGLDGASLVGHGIGGIEPAFTYLDRDTAGAGGCAAGNA